MSINLVREYFSKFGIENDILEFNTSSATVEMAANTIGVQPSRIAKTLSFMTGEGAILIVTAGDAKIDNGKFKEEFLCKAKMLTAEEVLQYTGHAVGGVCPFGLINELLVYLDLSLQRFDTVYPAFGSSNSAIQLTCKELERYSLANKWVDVCKEWQVE